MNNRTRFHGFTLIELMVVLALVAIMLKLAAPGLQVILANQRVGAAASSLQATAMQARSSALQSNQRVIVQPSDGTSSTDGTWTDGWRIYIDAAQNSNFDSGTDTLVLTQDALPTGITITKVTGTNNYFGYEGSGFLASIGGSSNATWRIESTATDRKKYLVIERSGRARVCDPKLTSPCP